VQAAGVVGVGAMLVAMVVDGAAVVPGAGAGSELPPVPFHTAGPGTVYVVATMAAALSMLKSIPGSEAEYAPGKETRYEPPGEAVPLPVTVNWAHSG
jgi:hypothetical protein